MEKGQTIAGKYRLNRALGAGGMASVWSATNVFTERDFAIKFLLPHVASAPEAARRFLLEAKVSARIDHPNIIEVIDVGQADDGSLFLVMELLNGMSLESAIRQSKPAMSAHTFLGIMLDVAEALEAAHKKGVVHRDLKPSNIFLHKDRDDQVIPKVLDFGVSKFFEEGTDGTTTIVGTILGSPLYMSPEQAMGAEGIDGRTDVFAFGSILFEALCGQRAYSATNLNALIVAIATTQPKQVEDVAPDLPPAAKDLIRDCMVTDKTQRLASFALVAEKLRPLIAHLVKGDLPLASARHATDPVPAGGGRPKRTSDRPPAPGALSGSGASVPPLSMAAPSAATDQVKTAPPGALDWRRARAAIGDTRSRPLTWAVAAGALVVVSVLVRVATGLGHPSAVSPGAVAAMPPPVREALPPAAPAAAPSPAESSNVPVVSVDSLPVAVRGGAPAKNGGRLSVVATPGWCSIAVDGTPRGSTPLSSFEIAPGPHRLECVPPAGEAKTADVVVAEGTEAHYQFTLVK